MFQAHVDLFDPQAFGLPLHARWFEFNGAFPPKEIDGIYGTNQPTHQ